MSQNENFHNFAPQPFTPEQEAHFYSQLLIDGMAAQTDKLLRGQGEGLATAVGQAIEARSGQLAHSPAASTMHEAASELKRAEKVVNTADAETAYKVMDGINTVGRELAFIIDGIHRAADANGSEEQRVLANKLQELVYSPMRNLSASHAEQSAHVLANQGIDYRIMPTLEQNVERHA